MGNALFLRIARASCPPPQLRLICTLWLAALPAVATAQPRYSWELSGSDFSSNKSDFDPTAIGATYYFDRVEGGEAPYALAAFFDPATLVSATWNHPSSSTDTWTVNGRYLLSPSRWYVGGQFTRNTASSVGADADTYGVVAGKYLGPRTTLELAIDTSRSGLLTIPISAPTVCSFPPCPLVSVTARAKAETASLSVIHVRQFRSLTYAFAGGLQQRETRLTLINDGSVPSFSFVPESSSLHAYSIETTLFPTKTLGVRVGYEDTFGSSSPSYVTGVYSVGARWFFRPKVAVEFSLSRQGLSGPLAPYGDNHFRSFRIIGRF